MRVKKYIIVETSNGLQIRFGYVCFHKDLLNEHESPKIIKGGGLWEIFEIDNVKTIILFGESFDYGKSSKNDIDAAIKNMTKRDWRQLCLTCKMIYKDEKEDNYFDNMDQTFTFRIK